ncbi:MAG: BatA and WFA domain-containing protein [Sandaracinus sp.]
MGLGVPLALIGLALAAVPVLAHLVRRSDVPERRLPTVALLERAVAESRRRVRVNDPLLLALRIALVTLLALAVAAPFVESEVAYGSGGLASVTIVLDDSMSMGRREGERTLFEDARARARDAIHALPEGAEVSVVLGGAPARVLVPRTTARDEAARALDDVALPGARGTDVEGAMALAARQLAAAAHAERRVLVLSDLALREDEALPSAPSGVRLDVETFGPALTPNLAIASVDAAEDPTIEGSMSVSVTVRAFGADEDHVEIGIATGDRVLARETMSLVDAGGRLTLHVLVPEGVTSAEARILDGGDALPLDDARAFSFEPSSAVRVLLVDGDPHPLGQAALGVGGASTRFVAQALALAPEGGPRFAVRRTDVETFLSSDETADVVALADVDVSREDVARRTRAAMEAGAGLLVAGGDHVHGGSSPLADRLAAHLVSVTGEARVGLSAGEAALPTRDEGLARVQITRALALDAPPERVALRFADGTPALAIDRAQRSAVLATSLDDAWSDLPLHPGFLATAVELFRALAPEGTMPSGALAPGTLPALRAPSGTSRVEIEAPDGSIVAFTDGLEAPIDLGSLASPGAYTVRVTDASGTHPLPRASFVLAAPLDESHLERRLSAGEAGETPATRSRTRVRSPLGPWVFGLAGLVALAEAWARRARTARAG